MKNFLKASAALLFLAASAGAASAQDTDHHDDHPAGAMSGPTHPAAAGPAMHGPAMAGPAMHGPAMAGPAMAGPPQHDWHKGGRIEQADWGRGQPIDYRQHHLKRPPHGYEWRQVDGNYVLAAAATGLIASIIAASH